jgi:hypothetical protein
MSNSFPTKIFNKNECLHYIHCVMQLAMIEMNKKSRGGIKIATIYATSLA